MPGIDAGSEIDVEPPEIPEIPNIRCVFYSEFHTVQGPVIVHQVPEGFISRKLFDAVHDTVIPKPQLCGKLSVLTALGHTILSHPVIIESNRYKRNAFIFNAGFVLSPSANVSAYETVIKKLARCLRDQELETSFLSNFDTKSLVLGILQQVLVGLNNERRCSIPISETYTLNLQASPILTKMPPVLDHMVPVFVTEPAPEDDWDLGLKHVVQFIDGNNHVKAIQELAQMKPSLVAKAIQNLMFFRYVRLVDIFQFGNTYVLEARFGDLLSQRQLMNDCVRFVAINQGNPPRLADVLDLYSSISPQQTIGELFLRVPCITVGIHPVRLIQFGIFSKILRRLHDYPILRLATLTSESSMITKQLHNTFDGSHSLDELGCQVGISPLQLREILVKDPSVVILRK
eukprot:Clim_evm49s232 gene=Clim_evmTU49s232